jgi:hypothetical protein
MIIDHHLRELLDARVLGVLNRQVPELNLGHVGQSGLHSELFIGERSTAALWGRSLLVAGAGACCPSGLEGELCALAMPNREGR